MEVNKGEAERCRDMGAEALRQRQFARAVKLFEKSVQLYPLPGVEALLAQAKSEERLGGSTNGSRNGSASRSTSTSTSSSNNRSGEHTGADGRAYTDDQVQVVTKVLRAKEGGRGAHYRVLGLTQDCTEAHIKKAYRKLSLKVHPDKNSAPHADEAFKALGMAYATLSDPQKRHIYDRYGDEDPDNRGGGMAARGGMHMRPGDDFSAEEIFNMFFAGMGGVPGGGGVHVYTTGFGHGPQFRAPRPQRARNGNLNANQPEPGFGLLLQLLPILLIAAFSFVRFETTEMPQGTMPGESKYFSLRHSKPFVNRLSTRLSDVKDIPYFVTDRFLQTYNRNRYQLQQVETMVERAYENYLATECRNQEKHKRSLEKTASQEKDEKEKLRLSDLANSFELSRCTELNDLFPRRNRGNGFGARKS